MSEPTQLPSYRRPAPPPAKPMLYATDKAKVEYLGLRGWSLARIARKLGTSVHHVRQLVDEITEDNVEEMANQPEPIRALYKHFFDRLARGAFREFEHSERDEPDLALIRIGIEAKALIRRVYRLESSEW